MKLRLAISMRVTSENKYREERDAISRDWQVFFAKHFPDFTLVPLMNAGPGITELLEELDIRGALLSNGNDLYESPRRDSTETAVVEYCLGKSLPVLGVCRGLQFINAFYGGSLLKDIRSSGRSNHAGTLHSINIESGAFAGFAGQEHLSVNSFHNQGVCSDGLASELSCFASAPDDIVEGIYHPDKPVLAIQWHPERTEPYSAFDIELIGRFFHEGMFWDRGERGRG